MAEKDMKEKLVEQLRELSDLTPPICEHQKPEEIELFGKKVTVYCKHFEQFQELLREAADYIANGVTVQEDCKDCAEATQNCIVKLQEQIAELRSVQKWISVKDRMPNEDDKYFVFKKTAFGCWCDVLGFAKDGRKVNKYDFGDQWKNVWYYYDSEYGYGVSENVTHWMPLPQPPKGE